MSKRIPSLLIEDIVECANKIIDFTSSQTFDEFMNDQRTVDAVIRNFEVIGEAANRLPDEFKEKNEIPHEYINFFLKGIDGAREILDGKEIEFNCVETCSDLNL